MVALSSTVNGNVYLVGFVDGKDYFTNKK